MINNFYNVHHKIKLQLDAICQEAGDMNVEEFMQVYNDICQEKITIQSAIANPIQAEKAKSWDELNSSNFFKEDMINDMDMGQDDDYYSHLDDIKIRQDD